MSELTLRAVPITPERFAPYGDLIYASSDSRNVMNDARFERFSGLADIDVDTKSGVAPSISIARCKAPMTLPYRFDLVERHPLGSQAFMPLSRFSFFVVVAPPGESVNILGLIKSTAVTACVFPTQVVDEDDDYV